MLDGRDKILALNVGRAGRMHGTYDAVRHGRSAYLADSQLNELHAFLMDSDQCQRLWLSQDKMIGLAAQPSALREYVAKVIEAPELPTRW